MKIHFLLTRTLYPVGMEGIQRAWCWLSKEGKIITFSKLKTVSVKIIGILFKIIKKLRLEYYCFEFCYRSRRLIWGSLNRITTGYRILINPLYGVRKCNFFDIRMDNGGWLLNITLQVIFQQSTLFLFMVMSMLMKLVFFTMQ